jgi:hypothetical protein
MKCYVQLPEFMNAAVVRVSFLDFYFLSAVAHILSDKTLNLKFTYVSIYK